MCRWPRTLTAGTSLKLITYVRHLSFGPPPPTLQCSPLAPLAELPLYLFWRGYEINWCGHKLSPHHIYPLSLNICLMDWAGENLEKAYPYHSYLPLRNKNAIRNTHSMHSLQDFWKQPKPYDNRRYYGNKYMRESGQENAASMDGLFSVLSRWPIRNNETTYTSLMYPQKFVMNSYNVYTVVSWKTQQQKQQKNQAKCTTRPQLKGKMWVMGITTKSLLRGKSEENSSSLRERDVYLIYCSCYRSSFGSLW